MVKRYAVICSMIAVFVSGTAFYADRIDEDLRAIYSQRIEQWPQPTLDEGVVFHEFKSLPRIDSTALAKSNDPKVKLGRLLFFDPILSGSNQISCSSCHNPQTSFADHLTVPIGHDHTEGPRNTISLLNVYARKSMFWDGRARTLEEQAIAPIEAHHEMKMDITKLIPKLKSIPNYVSMFEEAYGEGMGEDFSLPEVMKSLAEFQRTLMSRRSRFDEFLDGKHTALTDKEIKGMHLFRTKARCMNCHNGQFLTDEQFHNIGLTYYKRKYQDLGLYDATKNPDDVGKFRTPSLRDIGNTAPYMHNGLFPNLRGIINMYNSGMTMLTPTEEQKANDPMYPINDPLLKKLDLTTDEIEAVEAFLLAMTASKYRMPRPVTLPR